MSRHEETIKTGYIPKPGTSLEFRLPTRNLLINPLQPTTVDLFLLLHVPYISPATFSDSILSIIQSSLQGIAYLMMPTKMKCETGIPGIEVSEPSIVKFAFHTRLAEAGSQASDGALTGPCCQVIVNCAIRPTLSVNLLLQ